ncbi:MAG: translation initiation factor [Bacteroidales bacterium]|nr:translation initiation factor [Bacteroidales bacterium]
MNIVYSTNPDFDYNADSEPEVVTLPPAQQRLIVRLERRGGKLSTMVDGFVGTGEDLSALGRTLKNRCGVGGTAKDGVIIIQGDRRDDVLKLLLAAGYRAKRGN